MLLHVDSRNGFFVVAPVVSLKRIKVVRFPVFPGGFVDGLTNAVVVAAAGRFISA